MLQFSIYFCVLIERERERERERIKGTGINLFVAARERLLKKQLIRNGIEYYYILRLLKRERFHPLSLERTKQIKAIALVLVLYYYHSSNKINSSSRTSLITASPDVDGAFEANRFHYFFTFLSGFFIVRRVRQAKDWFCASQHR